jgi:hypothetical protein
MPIPSKKDNEKQADYMSRCMDFMKDEKYPQKQKVAICLNTFSQPKKKAKANEIEVDFSEDIKKSILPFTCQSKNDSIGNFNLKSNQGTPRSIKK